jgi:2'-hydroxyisoflavone reductase
MQILVIGGTRFAGRHFVEAALAAGHEVTLFHRGQTPAGLFPGAEEILGDRDGDLSALEGRHWDAVADFPGYLPSSVRHSARTLAPCVDRYLFVSTLSVYESFPGPGTDESAPLAQLPAGSPEQVTGETYGPLKALCEREVEAAFPGRALLVRPGYIVGPHDPTDRFTYWPVRIREAGNALAPGDPAGPLQVIDARDLGAWMVRLLESGATGAYNATGPAEPLTWGGFLRACDEVAGNGAHLTWVDEAFLVERGLAGSLELPLWAPTDEQGLHQVSIARALATGLAPRPLHDTIADTLSWYASRRDRPLAAGLSPQREQELLAAWHAVRPA